MIEIAPKDELPVPPIRGMRAGWMIIFCILIFGLALLFGRGP